MSVPRPSKLDAVTATRSRLSGGRRQHIGPLRSTTSCAVRVTQAATNIVKRCGTPISRAAEAAVAYVRFETEPGAQAQVDFGEFQVGHAGRDDQEVLSCSLMVLGYSRSFTRSLLERCDMVSFLDAHLERSRRWAGFRGRSSTTGCATSSCDALRARGAPTGSQGEG